MFQQPMFLILNLAIGGYDPSYTGVYSPSAVTAPFPAKMYVDYIRLTDNGYTQLYLGDNNAETGNFGVYTETTTVNDSLVYGTGLEPNFAYGTNAALYLWNNMTASTNPPPPSEGSQCWSFDIAGGNWFGMGVFLPNFRNMKNYSDGNLHFDIRTTSTVAMQVGIQSCRAGNFYLPLGGPDLGVRICPGWPMALGNHPFEPVCQHRFPNRQSIFHDFKCCQPGFGPEPVH